MVRKSGAEKASKKFADKALAVQFAQGLSKAEKTKLYVYAKDGRIEERVSFEGEV